MNRKTGYKLLFALYCALMLWLLFGQRIGAGGSGSYWQRVEDSLVLTPLETIRRFTWVLRHSTNAAQLRHAVVNLAGNVCMFVPLGFLVPCIWQRPRKFGWHFLTMTAIILAIELTQLFTLLGTCDVDDLLLNLVGTTMGFALWKLLHIEKRK